MPGTTGPNLGLVWGYAVGESGWGVGGYSPGFQILDSQVHLAIIDILSAPPSAPAGGDRYIVGAAATGSWTSHEDQIAVWNTIGAAGWVYHHPKAGWRAYSQATGTFWIYDSDWNEEAAITEITGDITAGPGPGTVSATLAIMAVTPGVYTNASITVDAKGRVTDAASGTSGGITQLTGDVAAGPGSGSVVTTLAATGVAPGSYTSTNLTVDGKGRITAASSGTGGSGGAAITVGDTPPASPTQGQLWFDGETACLYVFFVDAGGGAGQWVIAVNTGGGGGSGGVSSLLVGEGLTQSAAVGDVGIEIVCPIAIDDGGTGATDAVAALEALGGYPLTGGVLHGALQADGPVSASGYRDPMLDFYSDGTNDYVALYAAYAGPPNQGIYLGNGEIIYRNYKHTFVKADDPAQVWATLDVDGVTAKNFIAKQGSNTLHLYTDGEGHVESTSILHLNQASKSLVRVGGGLAVGENPYAILDRAVVGGEEWVSLYKSAGDSQHAGIHLTNSTSIAHHRMNKHRFQDHDGTVDWATIDNTGCYNISGSWSVISDRELKENIKPYTHGLDAVLNLTPHSYQYRGAEPVHIGLIADEVKPHLPEIVGSTVVEEQEVATLSPTLLLYSLINAIKELEARLRKLEP